MDRTAQVQDGNRKPIHDNAPPVEVDGCIGCFDLIRELSTEGLVVHRNERIVYANQAAATFLGAESPGSLVGREMESFVPEDHVPRLDGRRRRLASQTRIGLEEWDVVGLDGRKRHILVASDSVTFSGGPARLLVFSDLTVRQQAEAERDRLQDRLTASQRLESLGRLAGGVAHDFNNLLTVITGYAQLAERSSDGELQEQLVAINEAADRAAALTRQLLAFGRRQFLRPSVVDINEVVTSLGTMLQRLIPSDIDIRTELWHDACPVKVDRGQLEQVIVNLVTNAQDALPNGGEIVVATESGVTQREAIEGGTEKECQTVLVVKDNGRGMDAATRDRIFEPFYTTREGRGGTGLGLATVYGIVKQSGGAIEVDSEPGEGTTFRIWLPSAATKEDCEDRSRTGRPGPERLSEQHGTQIVFVEDDPQVRRLGAEILRRSGYQVIVAPDAEIALQELSKNAGEVDLLVTDIILPGMGGPALSEQVRESHKDLPVLFLSGYSQVQVLRDGLLEGHIDLLEKPFSPRTLLRRVREALVRARPC